MILSGFDPDWQENVICPFTHPWKARRLFVIVMQFKYRMSSTFQDLKNSLQSLTWTLFALMFTGIPVHISVCVCVCVLYMLILFPAHLSVIFIRNAAGQGIWPNHAHGPSHSCWRKHRFIYLWTVFFLKDPTSFYHYSLFILFFFRSKGFYTCFH